MDSVLADTLKANLKNAATVESAAQTPPNGKVSYPNGYELVQTANGIEWRQKWIFSE